MRKFTIVLSLIFSIAILPFMAQNGLRLNTANTLQQQSNPKNTLAQASRDAIPNDDAASIQSDDQDPLDAVKGKKELVDKRNQFSKTYQNEDGSFTALIGAGPIHYDNNGVWEDIDTKIIPNGNENFPYKNTTNLFSSYYGATAHKGIKSVTAEGEVLEFQNVKMAWEVNGQTVNNINAANSSATINNDIATYPHLFGNISAEFTSLVGKRELNYVIPNAQALSNAPANAEYLVFTEEINLPTNWTTTSTEKGIEVKDNTGEVIYLYPKPVSTDANSTLREEENTFYEMHQNGSVLTLKTKVKTEWLLSEERVFPVKVDPTTSVYPNNATNWTRGTASDGWDYGATNAVGHDGTAFVGTFMKFNSSSIPQGSTVTSATGYIYVTAVYVAWNGPWQFANSADPTTTSELSLYNSATTGYSTIVNMPSPINDLKSSPFMNPQGYSFIAGQLGNGYILTSVMASGSWSSGQYYLLANYSNNNRPYLSITYTVPSGCSGTPTGGTASAAPNSGTHNSSVTVSVSGSTSASGITYQWESAPTSSGPWTEILGATNATYDFNAPYENGTVYYRRKITCTASNSSAYSSVASFTTTCTPSYTTGNMPGGGYGYIGITNVTIGTINNTTGYQNNPPAYNYYSNLSTDVEIGQSYTLYVTYKDDGSPYNPGKIGVWVDWNNDGDFSDANEFIGIESNVANNAQKSFTITVPNGTTSGTKRLRIRSAFNDETVTSSDACTVLEYGETEDYNLEVIAVAPLICSTLDNLTPSLDDPINGPDHHLRLDWDGLTGATSYDVQFSIDGINYTNATPSNVPNNYAQLNAGDYPNERYWFRVRAKNATQTCDWTYSAPIYTACDVPELPNLTNAFGTSLDLTIQPETPVANPAYTDYAIVCETTGEYVQADGSLGASIVWQTNAQWGTVTVDGLTANSEYCFYLMARNGDGHIVGTPENSGNTIITETFDSNILVTGSSASNNVWFAPNSNTQISWNNTEGCPSGGGSIGYNGNWNNFWGNFVRLPQQDLTGVDEVVMTFDLTNSFTAGQTNNNFRLYINDGSSYQNPPTTVEAGGNTYTQQGINNYFYLFDEARTCEEVTVTYDISGIANKSALLFYIEVNSGYNNSNPFFFYIDNITLSEAIESSVPSECVTLGVAPTPTFYDYGGGMQLNFNNSKLNQDKAVFRLSHPGSTAATKYEIQVSPNVDFTGTPWSHVYTDNYTAQTQANFTFDETEGNLLDETTYYARARVDVGEGWGAWTTKTYSFTYVTDDIVEWFQTTTPQFVTGILDNVESTNDEARQIVSGGGGSNPVTNGNFATNLNGWTITTPYGTSNMKAERIGGTDSYCAGTCDDLPGTTTNLRMGSPDFGTATNNLAGESIIVAQQVNLTGIDEISFDVAAYYNLGNPSYDEAHTVLKFVVGGTLTNATGDATTIQTQPASYSYSGVSTKHIDVSSYTGNQVIKFVLTYNNVWHGNGAIRYYIGGVDSSTGGIIGSTAPYGIGTITSPAFHLASVATQENNYTEIYWTQEINSSLVMAVQHYNPATSVWEDVSGYDNISFPSSGYKTYDINQMTAYDSIRLKATMEGTQQVKLFDWGIRVKNNPLPITLSTFSTSCEEDGTHVFWTTQSETNVSHYEVYRSTNGVEWRLVDNQNAAGNSTSKLSYSFVDSQHEDIVYYKLKSVDFDGYTEEFGPISARCESEPSFLLYPNPNNGEFQLEISCTSNQNANISILDAQGRTVFVQDTPLKKGNNWILFNVQLTPGIYMIHLTNNDNNQFVEKMIVR